MLDQQHDTTTQIGLSNSGGDPGTHRNADIMPLGAAPGSSWDDNLKLYKLARDEFRADHLEITERFFKDNPHAAWYLAHWIQTLKAKNRSHYGINDLIGMLRWWIALNTDEDTEYQVNDAIAPYVARRFYYRSYREPVTVKPPAARLSDNAPDQANQSIDTQGLVPFGFFELRTIGVPRHTRSKELSEQKEKARLPRKRPASKKVPPRA